MNSIGEQRLISQQVSNPTFSEPAEVVAWLAALQGQDYLGGKWSIGLRLPDSTEGQIEQAIADRIIIRTWLMRGTLHMATRDDEHWLRKLVMERLISGYAYRYKQLELDDATLIQSNDILANALSHGELLTRKELFPILEHHGISTAGQRGVYMLQRASLDGLICQSIADKNNPSFFLLDAPSGKFDPSREEAVAELAKRYFLSRGPATIQDFAGWSGLTLTESRAGLQAVTSLLVEEVIDDVSYWRAASANVQTEKNPSPTVYLLPGFDEFYLGYKDRSAVIEPELMQNVCPGNNGMFMPTIVCDGRIIGTWKRTLKKNRVEIVLSPFGPLDSTLLDAIESVAQTYSDYLGLSLTFNP